MNEIEAEEPTPEPTFDDLTLRDEVRRAVADLGYVNPTPVQRAVLEPASRGRDLVVQARTGTGKTAAFGLPLVNGLVRPRNPEPQALVLSPTRELALQIHAEVEALGKYREVHCAAVYGGAAMQPQIDAIRAGAHIVVGTPGRVLDHLRRGTLDPSSIKVFVLDESDEMLSMGFLPQINDVIERLPERHQTLLFSATLPPPIVKMAETRLREPEFITLSGDHVGALEIEHYTYISRGNPLAELVSIIEVEDPESAIIFCNTRDETKRVARGLSDRGYSADWLNADLSQREREQVMRATRESRLRFLVATDVAARGIDISHLTHVINYDFPEAAENYIHRTGRTGRAGRTGTAISIIRPADVGKLYMLRLTFKIRPVERALPSPGEQRSRAELDIIRELLDRSVATRPAARSLSLARRILTHERSEEVIALLATQLFDDEPALAERAADKRRARQPRPVETRRDSRSERKQRDSRADDRPRDEARASRAEPARSSATGRGEDTGSRERHSRGESADRAPRNAESPQASDARTSEPKAARPEPRKRDERPAREEDRPRDDGDRPARNADGPRPARNADGPRPARNADGPRPAREDDRPRNDGDRPSRESAEGEDRKARRGRKRAPKPVQAHPERAAPDESAFTGDEPASVAIFVNAGRTNGVKAKAIRDLLSGDDLEGEVRVLRDHSFVEVAPEDAKRAVELLSGAKLGGAPVDARVAD